MSWNRSSDTPQPSPKKPAPSLKRGLLAGAIVILGAGLIAWLFSNGEADSRPLQKKNHGRIKEVKPAKAPKAKPVEKAEEPPPRKLTAQEIENARGCYTNKYGYVFNQPHTKRVVTNDVARQNLSLSARTFTNYADQMIGGVIEAPPGTMLVGSMPESLFGKDFVDSFLESIKEPIIVDKDDPEDVAALKRAVREAKIELKDYYDAGEDIGRVMLQAREELQTLGLYRDDLKREVEAAAAKDEMTKEDVEDFVKAANLLLDERGAKHITMPRMAIMRFNMENDEDNSDGSSN